MQNKKEKLIINASSVNGGGAKKRLLRTVSLLSSDYDLIVIKRGALLLDSNTIRCINLPRKLTGPLRLLSDLILPMFLFLLGYHKMYVLGNFFIGFYPGKFVWNLTNIEPFLVEKNSAYSVYHKFRLFFLRTLFKLSKKPDTLVVQSHFTKKVISQTCNIDSSKVVCVYNAVDISHGEMAPRPIEGTPNRILFVGQLVRYKRLELIIQQFYINKVFDEYELHIAGQVDWDVDYVSELKALVRKLHIETSVFFLGELQPNEVLQQYSSSRFLVYASLYDNCPNNILEAFALGLPVLAWENDVVNELSKFGNVIIVHGELDATHLTKIKAMHFGAGKLYDFSWQSHCKEISELINNTDR